MRNLLVPFGLKPKIKDETGPRYGDVYARAVAAAIDVMLVFKLLEWLFNRLNAHFLTSVDREMLAAIDPQAGLSTVLAQMDEAGFFSYWFTNAFVQFTIIGLVYVGCQWAFHTTPGKWLMGLKIVRRSDHAANPSRLQYVLRYLAYAISCAPLMLGFIWASFNKERRTWHDTLVGTVVLDLRPKGWYWQQLKKGFRRLRGQSTAMEQPVAEPPAEQRHDDSGKPIN